MARDPDQRKRPGGAADRRRAQTYLAQLEWLDGVDGSWQRWDTGEPFALDGAAIAKARRAARTVKREHASALPRLVGDVDKWWAIVDAKLAWCSACATGTNAAFDPRPFLAPRIVRAIAGLHGVIGEAAWRASVAWVGQPASLERVLGWLASRVDALATAVDIDARIALTLARMVVFGEPGKAAAARERGVDALIAILAADAPDPIAALDVTRHLESCLLDQKRKTAAVPNRSSPRAIAWVQRLGVRGSTERQRALELLAETRVADALGAWAAWEREHAGLIARATELAAHQFDKLDKAVHGTRVIQKLVAARSKAPVPVSIKDVILEVDMLAAEIFERFHPSIVRLLAALPAAAMPESIAATARTRMLLHCARTVACAHWERIDWVWNALADAFERGALPSLLEPWRPALATDGRLWIEDDFAEDMKRPSDVARVIRVMLELAKRRGTVAREDGQRAAAWLKAGLSDETVLAEVVIGLRDVDERLETDVARAILALADDALENGERQTTGPRRGTSGDRVAGDRAVSAVDDESLGQSNHPPGARLYGRPPERRSSSIRAPGETPDSTLTATTSSASHARIASIERVGRLVMAATKELRYASVRRFVTLIDHAVKAGGGWIVLGMLEAGQGSTLDAVADVFPLLQRSRLPPIVTEREAPWIARYPAVLAQALQRLASVDPDAEATAAKRLATDLPDPAALRREIAALRERAGSGRAGIAKRLANLEARLAAPKTPSAKRLANLVDKLERTARDIGLQRFRAALDEVATSRIVRAFGLDEWPAWGWERKTLAILFQLLQLGDVDRELAGRLLRARCGPPPWDLRDDPANRAYLDQMRRARIDPAPWLDDTPHVVKINGEPISLSLCSDPLEVFEMGAHFETCLSPDGGNFFSVVANAADINKRVLYARRGKAVVGRCLFALTDSFALLAFQAYCHEQIDFQSIVRDFAVGLAQRMGTTLVPRGSVRTLLAREWYDDGSRDLVGRFRGLDDAGLDFDTIDPSTLVSVLRAALEREIDDVTLPIILNHNGVIHRPELVFPLAPYALASSTPLTRVTAASLALVAGDPVLADRLLGEHAGTIRIEHHVGPFGDLLARLRPSYALARLRQTRASYVRTWKDESGDRIALAGLALQTLHRPKQAAEMYRLAMAEDYLKPIMRARLAELGESVDDE